MTEDRTTRLKRLRYRSWHRGTKELDLLVGPFADAALAGLEDDELDLYERLLEAPEPLLHAMITGTQSPVPPYDHPVLARMIAFHAGPGSA